MLLYSISYQTIKVKAQTTQGVTMADNFAHVRIPIDCELWIQNKIVLIRVFVFKFWNATTKFYSVEWTELVGRTECAKLIRVIIINADLKTYH